MDVWLSGAVVAAFVAGIFAVITSLINSRRLTKLEHWREQSRREEQRLASVRSAYEQFCNTNSPANMLNNLREGDDGSTVITECNVSIQKYTNLIKKVEPDLDSDLYREWDETVEAYDKALGIFLEAPEKQSADTWSLIDAICNMERICGKVLNEQIKRLSGSGVNSSK